MISPLRIGNCSGVACGAEPNFVKPADLDLLTATAHQYVLQKEEFDAGSEKSANCFLRGVDDRLAFHVEAGVEHHLPARNSTDGPQQRMKCRVVGGGYGLHAGRSV